jgi:DNA-binding MarR family transcriptional regulator
MSTPIPFGTQLIGQTEKTLNAILGQLLAGTDLSEPQWVGLNVALASGGTLAPDQLVDRLAGALKVSDGEAQARLSELVTAQLLDVLTDRSPVGVTEAGRELHTRIRSSVTEITERLWGDLPSEDLEAAGRVLRTVLERANTELHSD